MSKVAIHYTSRENFNLVKDRATAIFHENIDMDTIPRVGEYLEDVHGNLSQVVAITHNIVEPYHLDRTRPERVVADVVALRIRHG